VRLSEELARVLRPPARRKRRAGEDAPREIVPGEGAGGPRGGPAGSLGSAGSASEGADPFEAARARLKSQIPPPEDETGA
jgi:hypothetical protein